MKLYLSDRAFKALVQVSQEMKIPQSELVSQLILDYCATPIEERDMPKHRCGICSVSLFSHEALEAHIQHSHGEKPVEQGR